MTDPLQLADAMKSLYKMWKSANGAKVEEWYDNWYQTNKDTYMFTGDVYDALGAPYEK